jgi:hypothetical protein
MAVSNINTAWKNDLYPLIDSTFDYEYANMLNKFKEIVSEENKQGVDFRFAGMGGFGELPNYRGTTLSGLNQKRGFVKIITPDEKAGAIDIQRAYALIDKSGEAKAAGEQAAYSAGMTVYLALLRMFAGAYNTNMLGGDGKAWAATDHPVASKGDAAGVSTVDSDSGTYSNLVTTALSVSAITAAQTLSARYVTPDGLPWLCNFEDNGILLVSPELAPKAKEICGVNSQLTPEKIPESAENGANPLYGLKYMVVGGGVDGFSAKQWAIADRTMLKKSTKIVYVEKPTVLKAELDNPLIARIVPYVYFGVGFNEARAIVFSNPA